MVYFATKRLHRKKAIKVERLKEPTVIFTPQFCKDHYAPGIFLAYILFIISLYVKPTFEE
jgi:hypothetical protein